MNLLSLSVFILIWLSSDVCTFDNEDYQTLLCAADEDYMEDIYEICEAKMRDAVDGCFIKCFIELRNKRAPTTRIDEKYYQFVMCDTQLYYQFQVCASPCIGNLKVSYDGWENLFEWMDCMVETVRNFEYKIDHQDDPEPAKGGNDPKEENDAKGGNDSKGGNNPKRGKGSGKKNGGGSGSKVKPKKKNDTKDNSKGNNNSKGKGKGGGPKDSDKKSKLKMRMNKAR